MFKKITKAMKFLVGWPLSLIALIFLWRFFTPELPQIISKLQRANFFLLIISLFVFFLYFLFRVLLWQRILIDKGHQVPFLTTAWYWSIAEINRYIPGNIWSVVGRGSTFGTLGIKQSKLLLAWGQESVLVLLGSFLVGLLGTGIIASHVLPWTPYNHLLSIVIYILAFCLVFLWLFQTYLSHHWLPKKIHDYSLSPIQACMQLLFGCISFFFFGFGTYLSIYSLTYLSIPESMQLIGLFVASFFIGYVSLITPMGLGVRELVMSDGLLPFVAHSLVGFLSIFARFILTISELLFLGVFYLLHKKRFRLPQAVLDHMKKYGYYYALFTCIVLYCVYFIVASVLRYTNFFTGRFDLGNMDQTVWNTLHGKIFQLTDPNGTNVMSRLGTHADFILILIAPFYLIWQDPRMLLIIQTLIVALGAFFVFLLAKDTLKKRSFAFLLAVSFLLNPSIQNANLYDFHAVTLATTFFLAGWYFLKKQKVWWSLLFLFLAGITKEEAWLVVGLFGVYIFFWEKRKILGSIVTGFSLLAFYLLVWKFIPFARGGQHFALSYYADFGSTPTSVIKNILFSPQKIIALLLSHTRLIYLYELLLPVGFLALLAPQYLIFCLSELGINLLSANTQMQQIFYQYTAVITPFIFIATIYAAAHMTTKFKQISLSFLGVVILSGTLLSAYWFGPLPGAVSPNIDMFVHQETDRSTVEGFLQDIPPSYSVAATNNIGSHLSHRQKIFTIPVGIDKADIVVFLLNDAFAQPSLLAQKQMAEMMKHDKNYIEVFKENDFIVFEKRNLYTTRQSPVIEKGKLYPSAIEALQHRDFEGGDITIQKTLSQTTSSTTILFSYPSDGLTLYGKADIPKVTNSQALLPVVIINRGYIQSSVFKEETSYENIAREFVQNGFIAITPDYRNNGESDTDSNIAGILSYPIDVLNLLNSIPHFPQADSKHVFLWGFSVGGQVTLSTLAAYDQNPNMVPTVKAASVWTPVSDPYTAYERFHELFPGQNVPYQRAENAFGSFRTNPIPWESVSPLYYAQDITTPVRIVDAFQDTVTPYEWSVEFYDNLKYYHSSTTLQLYNTDHNFTNTWEEVVTDDIQYFKEFLSK